ncbi:MAG: sugar O-acetyltransferase [Clostridia bacterium]|nr:sugar O-acetyltransferase [Clostridia bacterium]
MRQGKIYNPTDKLLLYKRIRTRMLADKYNRTHAWNNFRRFRLIKKIFPHGEKGAFFEPNIRVEYGENVTFGKNFYMNFDCSLLDVATIEIGDNVMFGARVTVATPVHPLLADERRMQDYGDGFYDLEYSRPVKIGNDVWVASNVTICGGVTIGDNAVIGAGSVVTRDIPPNVFAAGVPCRVVRPLTEEDRLEPKKMHEMMKNEL